jgi:secreted trypsin-like serine protease
MDDQRAHQVGIETWSVGYGDFPEIYTNISVLRDWIDQKMKAKQFDINSYTAKLPTTKAPDTNVSNMCKSSAIISQH